MTNIVEFIAKSLVNEEDKVVVTEKAGEYGGKVITLQVAADDMGKVIGKKGRIARALRTVVKAAAVKENVNVSVEILSDEELADENKID